MRHLVASITAIALLLSPIPAAMAEVNTDPLPARALSPAPAIAPFVIDMKKPPAEGLLEDRVITQTQSLRVTFSF